MGVFGIGIDIVEIDRIEDVIARHGQRFLEKVLTDGERDYCLAQARPAPHIAARFAVKEAVAKALGTGIGAELGWLDMEVVRSATGAPVLVLAGAGAGFARRHGISEVKISLSHARDYAAAQAVAILGAGG